MQIAQRLQNPRTQPPATHRRGSPIKNCEQTGIACPAGFDQLKIRLGRGVEHDVFCRRIAAQRGEMIDVTPKLVLQIMNDCARGSDRLRHFSAAESIQRFRFEMLTQGEDRLLRQKRVAVVLERVIDVTELIFLFGTDEQFRRRNAREFVKERLPIWQLGEPELAGGEVRVSKTKYAAVGVNRAEIIR